MKAAPADRPGRILLLLLVAAANWGAVAAPARGGGAHPDFEVKVSGQGQPVIFIPGLATPGVVWDATVGELHGSCQCHVLTLAGFGQVKASGSDPFLPRVRDEIIAYIRAEKLDHPVIVGHSLGGFLALWVGITAPELPGRMVIVDALPFLPAIMNPASTPEAVQAGIAPMIAQMAAAKPAQFTAILKEMLSTMVTSPENAQQLLSRNQVSDPKTTARAFKELLTTDLRPDLAKVTCPVLVLAALADKVEYAPREAIMANYRQQYTGLAGARFEGFAAARHFIMVDDLPGFMKVLRPELSPAAGN